MMHRLPTDITSEKRNHKEEKVRSRFCRVLAFQVLSDKSRRFTITLRIIEDKSGHYALRTIRSLLLDVGTSLLYCVFCAIHEGSFRHGAQSPDSRSVQCGPRTGFSRRGTRLCYTSQYRIIYWSLSTSVTCLIVLPNDAAILPNQPYGVHRVKGNDKQMLSDSSQTRQTQGII